MVVVAETEEEEEKDAIKSKKYVVVMGHEAVKLMAVVE